MDKNEIRRIVRARKAMLDDNERRDAAHRVFETLASMAPFMLADKILLYHSLPDELSTREFIEAYASKKQFFLPRVNGLDLEILPCEKSRLHLGAFQIEEPDGADIVDISEIDLVVVPGVAYDRACNRVGRGKGYYDRLLSQTRATTVGVAYHCQVFDEVDTEEHDIPVHFVITEKTTYRR